MTATEQLKRLALPAGVDVPSPRGLKWLTPLLALALSACLFMLVAGVLFAVDAVIQAGERKKPSWPDTAEHGPRPR